MSDDLKRVNGDFSDLVSVREKRKLRARKKKMETFWFGLGMVGMVGWSIAIPTVGGIFLGVWIDLRWSGTYSWTLMLMVIGLVIGCLNVWFWVNRQRQAIGKEREDEGD